MAGARPISNSLPPARKRVDVNSQREILSASHDEEIPAGIGLELPMGMICTDIGSRTDHSDRFDSISCEAISRLARYTTQWLSKIAVRITALGYLSDLGERPGMHCRISLSLT